MAPLMAEAATTSGEARYASASREPMRPLKLRLVAEIPTSPSFNRPVPRPMQGPQPAGSGLAPALTRTCQSPAFSAAVCSSDEAAAM